MCVANKNNLQRFIEVEIPVEKVGQTCWLSAIMETKTENTFHSNRFYSCCIDQKLLLTLLLNCCL